MTLPSLRDAEERARVELRAACSGTNRFRKAEARLAWLAASDALQTAEAREGVRRARTA